MAGIAPDLVEKPRAFSGLGRLGERRVARRGLRCPDEPREAVNIFQAVRAGRVVGLGDRVAQQRDLVGKQLVGDAHFVQVSVAGE